MSTIADADVPLILKALLAKARIPGPALQTMEHRDTHDGGADLVTVRSYPGLPNDWTVLSSEFVAWDWHGHVHVNDRQVCCHTWWRRALARMLRRHV
jgi:hypothetical protein